MQRMSLIQRRKTGKFEPILTAEAQLMVEAGTAELAPMYRMPPFYREIKQEAREPLEPQSYSTREMTALPRKRRSPRRKVVDRVEAD